MFNILETISENGISAVSWSNEDHKAHRQHERETDGKCSLIY
jgi:hypothetical protein